MQYLVRRLFLVFSFAVLSLNVNASVIQTGDLSYDSATNVITGTNGLYYLAWNVALGLTYEETVAATETGGIYESYHIANQYDAAEFFQQATGIAAPYTSVEMSDGAGSARFGANNFNGELVGLASVALFLVEEQNYTGVGLMTASYDSLDYTLDEIDISVADEYTAGPTSIESPITWLLVSDSPQPSSVSEPGSMYLLGLGLLCLVRARRIVSI